MSNNRRLKICFAGGKKAGIVGAIAAISSGHRIVCAVSYSEDLSAILKFFNIPLCKSVNHKKFIDALKKADVLLSVHGREIIKESLIKMPLKGAVNLHPYLYRYKGANPVGRAFKEGNFKASVGAHIMTNIVDEGRVLVEKFMNVGGSKNVDDIYNRIYPLYADVALKVLEMMANEKTVR